MDDRSVVRLGLLLLSVCASSAEAAELAVRGQVWFPMLDGDAQVSEGPIQGTEVDLEDDLGVDTSEIAPGADIVVRFLNRNTFFFSYWRAGFEGDKILEQTIIVGDKVYPVASRVKTELDFDVFEVGYRFDVIRTDPVSAGLFLDVETFLLHAKIEDTTGFASEEEDLPIPIPTVGAAVDAKIIPEWLSVKARINGMGFDAGDIEATFLDVSGEAELHLTDNIGAFAGYRFMMLDGEGEADDEELALDVTLQGAFVGAGLRF